MNCCAAQSLRCSLRYRQAQRAEIDPDRRIIAVTLGARAVVSGEGTNAAAHNRRS
jgi:hypothetical protein